MTPAEAKAALDQCGGLTRDEFMALIDSIRFIGVSLGIVSVKKIDGRELFFSSYSGAINNAVSGEIVVLHSNLTEVCILKNNVNVNLNGFTLSSNTAGNTYTLSDNGANVSCSVFGYGNITRLTNTGSTGGAISISGTGTVSISCRNISSVCGYAINKSSTSNVRVFADVITAGNNGEVGNENHTISIIGGRLSIYAARIISTSISTAVNALYQNGGAFWVEGAMVLKSATNSTTVNKVSGAIILKNNVYIVPPATTGGSLNGDGDCKLYGTNLSNVSTHPSSTLTFSVGLLTINPSVTDI